MASVPAAICASPDFETLRRSGELAATVAEGPAAVQPDPPARTWQLTEVATLFPDKASKATVTFSPEPHKPPHPTGWVRITERSRILMPWLGLNVAF
jgi:hypothetical protein